MRELQNVVERAVITSRFGDTQLVLDPLSVSTRIIEPTISELAILSEEEMQQFQRENILRALQASEGKIYGKDGAAHLLNIKPSTLCSRMRKMGIQVGRRVQDA